METIKRQMDSLTEMVNDLQIQMEFRNERSPESDLSERATRIDERIRIDEQPAFRIMEANIPEVESSVISSESDNIIQSTTAEEDSEEEFNGPVVRSISRVSSKRTMRHNNRKRLRWRSFYTAHQVAKYFCIIILRHEFK